MYVVIKKKKAELDTLIINVNIKTIVFKVGNTYKQNLLTSLTITLLYLAF